MVHNDATPDIQVDPETYRVTADGELLVCEPATVLPMAQRYFLFGGFPMLRATSIVRKPAVRPERVVDRVTLDHEGRNRRRIALKAEGGLDFLLDLERAAALNDGDAVKLEDGRLVQVQAAPQRLLEVRAENPLR